jgi:tetrahydromethanopterin S-methyltransferase subunit G
MVEKEFNEWDMKLSEWRGYVVRALEDSNKELLEIKENLKVMEEKLDKANGRLTGMQIKVAGIGSVSGLLVTLITLVITGAL